MKERSVAQVKRLLAAEEAQKQRIISRQSFYCRRRGRVVTPAFCHDCFASLPYLVRLTRWNEDRARCIEENRVRLEIGKGPGHKPSGKKRKTRLRPVAEPSYSIEEYLCRGLLEFGLELEAVSEDFTEWWLNLADAARQRIHTSEEAGEMILWLAGVLRGLEGSLLKVARRPEEIKNHEKKEETCGVRN